MKRIISKWILSILLFIIRNFSGQQIILLEAAVFIVYQLLLQTVIRIYPLPRGKHQKTHFIISQIMFAFTVIFWWFIVVGPFWMNF